MVRKLRPPARDVNQPPEPNRSALAGLPVSKCFLEVDAIRLSGDRRLQAERTEAAAQFPMALLVKLDRLAEALHLT
jgi:hypothetical protein